MEDILRQRFNFARISPYRNYTPIDSHHEPKKNKTKRSTSVLDIDLLDIESNDSDSPVRREYNGISLMIPKKENTKYKRKFFYGDDIEERHQIVYPPSPFFEKHNEFLSHEMVMDYYTVKDRHIKSFYNSPFSSIEVTTIEKSIVRHGDKITFKTYRHMKTRGVNCKYFRNRSIANSLTYNTITGNFTTVRYEKNPKHKSSRIRTNSFEELEFFINRAIERKVTLGSPNKLVNELYAKSLDGEAFLTCFIETLGLNCTTTLVNKLLIEAFIEKFVEVKKIKVPNVYVKFLTKYYPTEKFFKKNERKLISSITDMFKIKSKITNKILHESPDVHLPTLIGICQLFGENYPKYIGNIKKEQFCRKEGRYYPSGDETRYGILNRDKIVFDLTHKEKENILGIINTHPSGVSGDCLRTILDHINMILTLRDLTEIDFKARNYTEFNREHSEYSKLMSMIRKAYVNEFVFNEKMTTDVEEPIVMNKISDDGLNLITTTYHPILLRREEEYIEEGSYVHHCVAGYANRETSIIVSLRNYENGDRVTSEYDVRNGNCVQSKYYHNSPPPSDFLVPLKRLQDKISKHAMKDRLKMIERKKVRAKINGIEIPIDFVPNIHRLEVNYF